MPTIGKPFPSKDFKIQVADVNVTPVWKDVGLMTSWDSDANEQLSETEVFHQADPITTVGRETITFMLNGLLSSADDDGQAILNAHVAARDYFMLKVLWDGTNGFTAQVRNASRKRTGRAGNSFAETQWSFSLLPSTITIVALGPTL